MLHVDLDLLEHGITQHDIIGRNNAGIQDLFLSNLPGNAFQLSSERMGVRLYGLIGASVTPDLMNPKQTKSEDSGKPLRVVSQKGQKAKKEDDDMKEEADPMDRMTGLLWEVGAFNSDNLSKANGAGIVPNNPSPNNYQARINAYFSGDSFVGIAGYTGLMSTENTGPGPANRFRMVGPDFAYHFGKPFEKSQGMFVKPYTLYGGYLAGQADNPAGDGKRYSFNGYFATLEYAINPKSICYIRYDKINGNNLGNAFAAGAITDGITANYSYYFRTNFWAGLEYTHDLSPAKQDMLGLVFNLAF